MSRSKKEWNDTESMLTRLTMLLADHGGNTAEASRHWRQDAESLRRISMTLHRWHELECGDSNSHGSWTIVRGHKKFPPGFPGAFEYDESGQPFLECRNHNENFARYSRIPDRERGARKRLAAILKRYPTLTAYVQGDPRGCALYILKPGDVPEGADVSSCYSRGLAVFK